MAGWFYGCRAGTVFADGQQRHRHHWPSSYWYPCYPQSTGCLGAGGRMLRNSNSLNSHAWRSGCVADGGDPQWYRCADGSHHHHSGSGIRGCFAGNRRYRLWPVCDRAAASQNRYNRAIRVGFTQSWRQKLPDPWCAAVVVTNWGPRHGWYYSPVAWATAGNG